MKKCCRGHPAEGQLKFDDIIFSSSSKRCAACNPSNADLWKEDPIQPVRSATQPAPRDYPERNIAVSNAAANTGRRWTRTTSTERAEGLIPGRSGRGESV